MAAAVDWVAVARRAKSLEYWAKPATMLLLVGAAVALQPTFEQRRWWFVAALALSLLGDVFLMLRDERFVAGLASFLLAHLAYVGGFAVEGRWGVVAAAVAALVFLAAGVAQARVIVPAVPDQLRPPVLAYMAVISTMAVVAGGKGPALAVAAAVLFYASDSLIAWNKFVRPQAWMRLGIIVTYHVAQALFVVSLV